MSPDPRCLACIRAIHTQCSGAPCTCQTCTTPKPEEGNRD